MATGHDIVFGNSSASNPGWPPEQSLFAPGDQGQNAMVGLRAFRIEKFANMLLGRPGRTTPCPFPWCGDQCELPECPRSRIWRKQDVISEDRRLRAIPFRVSTPYPSIPRVATHDSIIFGSYEPQLAAFVSLPYLGSTFESGNLSHCIHGLDNAGNCAPARS